MNPGAGSAGRPALPAIGCDPRWIRSTGIEGIEVLITLPACPAAERAGTGQEAGLADALARALAARARPGVRPSLRPAEPAADAAPPAADGCPADALPTGLDLAAWLSGQDLGGASDHDVVAMASAWRRVASWAQAGELAAVAQVAARSAARDPDAGLGAGGRPACLTRDAAARVSFELVLSRVGAEAWAGLALDLAWRLPGTAAALAEGRIDLVRARILAEAIAPLSDEAALAVEARVLARAGGWTYAQLRSAVRRAVISVDPDGAEHRRQAAERRAKVSLYPDQDCTATLAGTRLPAAQAAAAMARVSAMAQALKAAGAGGGLHLLRAQVYLGLLLGSLPLIPPPAGGPPDTDPPEDGPPYSDLPCSDLPDDSRDDGHQPGDGPRPGDGAPSSERPGGGDRRPGDGAPSGGSPGGGDRRPGDGTPPDGPPSGGPDDRSPRSGHGQPPARGRHSDGSPPPHPGDAGPAGASLPPAGPWTDAPPLTDADLSRDEGWRDMPQPVPGSYADWDPDRGDPADHELYADPGIIWPWPGAPVSVGPRPGAPGAPAPGAAGRDASDPGTAGLADTGSPGRRPAGSGQGDPGSPGGGRPPPGGLIDLTLSWATLTGAGQAPGTLGRIGPITAPQARALARMATINHATVWRVILTDPDGTAIAVARVPRPRIGSPAAPGQPPGDLPPGDLPPGDLPPADAPPGGAAPTIGRVTVVMPAAALHDSQSAGARPVPRNIPVPGSAPAPSDPSDPVGLAVPADLARACTQVTAAARRAHDAARRQADADQHAAGGCAHTTASPAYRPPPRLREMVTARDQTCRNPRCGQPAWRGDLDHTKPYHLGGLTCGCNLGGFCRGDHRLKQLPGWTVTQPRPGIFTWTSPAGRTYTTRPDPHHTS